MNAAQQQTYTTKSVVTIVFSRPPRAGRKTPKFAAFDLRRNFDTNGYGDWQENPHVLKTLKSWAKAVAVIYHVDEETGKLVPIRSNLDCLHPVSYHKTLKRERDEWKVSKTNRRMDYLPTFKVTTTPWGGGSLEINKGKQSCMAYSRKNWDDVPNGAADSYIK
jgi:hypothetical protein